VVGPGIPQTLASVVIAGKISACKCQDIKDQPTIRAPAVWNDWELLLARNKLLVEVGAPQVENRRVVEASALCSVFSIVRHSQFQFVAGRVWRMATPPPKQNQQARDDGCQDQVSFHIRLSALEPRKRFPSSPEHARSGRIYRVREANQTEGWIIAFSGPEVGG
jgi:hypothetical protein